MQLLPTCNNAMLKPFQANNLKKWKGYLHNRGFRCPSQAWCVVQHLRKMCNTFTFVDSVVTTMTTEQVRKMMMHAATQLINLAEWEKGQKPVWCVSRRIERNIEFRLVDRWFQTLKRKKTMSESVIFMRLPLMLCIMLSLSLRFISPSLQVFSFLLFFLWTMV